MPFIRFHFFIFNSIISSKATTAFLYDWMMMMMMTMVKWEAAEMNEESDSEMNLYQCCVCVFLFFSSIAFLSSIQTYIFSKSFGCWWWKERKANKSAKSVKLWGSKNDFIKGEKKREEKWKSAFCVLLKIRRKNS